jgi:hypothetical protein
MTVNPPHRPNSNSHRPPPLLWAGRKKSQLRKGETTTVLMAPSARRRPDRSTGWAAPEHGHDAHKATARPTDSRVADRRARTKMSRASRRANR